VVEQVCETLSGYATDEQDVEWSSCLQKDADGYGGEVAAMFTLRRMDIGENPNSIDYENSLKYMYHKRKRHRGGFPSWPSK